jgi:hypothetical protein
MLMIFNLAAAFAALTVSGAQPADQAKPREPADPTRMVCEDVKITGSRLARRRVCMTAAQWADERRQTQQRVEQLQVRGRREDQ